MSYIHGFPFDQVRGSGSGTEEDVLTCRYDPKTGASYILLRYGASVSAGVGVGVQVSGSNWVAKKAYDHQQTVGVTMAAASTSEFGWAQHYGKSQVAIKTDGTATAGGSLKNSAGTWVQISNPTTSATAHLGYIIAGAADSGTTLASGNAYLCM